MERLQIVSNAYFKEVIPLLIPGLTTDTLYSSSSSLLGDCKFNIDLNSNAFIDSLPKKYKPINTRVIQFTSLKVLFSILNEKSIRMYNLKNMNDPQEFNYLFDKLDDNEDVKFTKEYYRDSIYLSSFCSSDILKSSSALNLWRLYGSEGYGVAIEFNIPEDIKHKRDFTFCKVAYDDIDLSKFRSANEAFEKKYKVEVDYSELFKIPACMHKNPAYSVEQEERLVYYGKRHIPTDLVKDDYPYNQDVNKFNEVLTYFKLPLYNVSDYSLPKITISKIQFGFKISENKFAELKEELKAHFWNLSNLDLIEETEIPILEMSPLTNIYR